MSENKGETNTSFELNEIILQEANNSQSKEDKDLNHKSEKQTDENIKKNHRKKILLSLLINVSFFFSVGINDAIRGPTLLDLRDHYSTSLSAISAIFLCTSIGSLGGSFFTGFIMDKFPMHHTLIVFLYNFLTGVFLMLYPFMGDVTLLYFLAFMAGINSAGVDTGANILILDIWRDGNSGPFLHSIHFSFALGAFVAPLVAGPFLSTQALSFNQQGEEIFANSTTSEEFSGSKITTLYPIVGLFPIIVSFGFLFFYIQEILERKKLKKLIRNNEVTLKKKEMPKTEFNKSLLSVLIPMTLFYFIYHGMEVTFGIFLTAFGENSNLELSRIQGANLTAIFWGAFAIIRFLSIFAAIKLNPIFIMNMSFILSAVGAVGLSIFGEDSLMYLQIFSAVVGAGMASIYATGILWLEQYVVISGPIASSIIIASSLGPDVFPLIIGQLIETYPMSLMYLTLLIVLISIIIFYIATIFAKKFLKK